MRITLVLGSELSRELSHLFLAPLQLHSPFHLTHHYHHWTMSEPHHFNVPALTCAQRLDVLRVLGQHDDFGAIGPLLNLDVRPEHHVHWTAPLMHHAHARSTRTTRPSSSWCSLVHHSFMTLAHHLLAALVGSGHLPCEPLNSLDSFAGARECYGHSSVYISGFHPYVGQIRRTKRLALVQFLRMEVHLWLRLRMLWSVWRRCVRLWRRAAEVQREGRKYEREDLRISKGSIVHDGSFLGASSRARRSSYLFIAEDSFQGNSSPPTDERSASLHACGILRCRGKQECLVGR